MPLILRRAISPGIGLFIAFIGLKNAGIVSASDATLVTLGNLHSPAVLLACFGILLTSVLLVRNVVGALLIGILATTIIGIPLGVTNFTGFLDTPPSISPILMKFEWSSILSVDMAICVITFLFIDMFDTIGTLIGVSNRAGMVDENGNIPRLGKAFMADAVGTTVGAMLGTSTVTTYVESASGVGEGGRTGLTAFSTAVCFALALFFSPLFLAIPSAATAPALIIVGVMMMPAIKRIHWEDYCRAIPAFLTIIIMPLAYSISDGILIGVISYVVCHIVAGKFKSISITMWILAILFICKYIFI